MATITIRASDSAAALDEALRQLGPDAMILSTRQHRGQVEIVARSGSADDGGLRQGAGQPAAARGMPSQVSPVTGFGDHLRQAMARDIVAAPPVLPPHLPGRIVLAGPPGAGRSMLAARLAAGALRAVGAASPTLIAPRRDMLCPPGLLAGWARLLGLVPHRPVWGTDGAGPLSPPGEGETQIVDLSALPPLPPEDIANLAALPEARLWLVLPSGLHPTYQDAICAPLAGLADVLVLTRTDLCPPTPEDLDLPRRHRIPAGLMAHGGALLDALAPWPAADAPAACPNPHPTA